MGDIKKTKIGFKFQVSSFRKISWLLVLFGICFMIVPISVWAATLYLMPQSQTIYQEDSFIVEVRLDTEGEEINTVGANLIFPPDLLDVLDFSEGNSVLSLWPKESEIQGNEISFVGGIPQGFVGDGLILKITFRTRVDEEQEIKIAEVGFKENSKVLLNDGMGSLAELFFLEGSYEIIKKPEKLPLISSNTHPDQDKWYKGNTLHLHWDLVQGALYSYLLSKDPLVGPDEIPDKPEGELMWIGDMEYPNLEDGIYYFHLRQATGKQEELTWGPKVTFRVMIDATSPEPFELKIGQDIAVFEGRYFLGFAATDKMSGIEHYEILEIKRREYLSENGQNWKVGESPYLLEDQSLQSIIKVKAVDKAGNERIAEYIPPEKPTPFPWWTIGLVLIGGGVIWWIFRRIFVKPIRNKMRNRYET